MQVRAFEVAWDQALHSGKKKKKSALAKKKKNGERSEPRVTVQLASLAEPGPRLPLRLIINLSNTHKLLKRDAGTFQVCIF